MKYKDGRRARSPAPKATFLQVQHLLKPPEMIGIGPMPNLTAPSFLETLSIRSARELEHSINGAVERAIEVAAAHPGSGLLVTRHDHTTFTVELSNEVPHGLIVERDHPKPMNRGQAVSSAPEK